MGNERESDGINGKPRVNWFPWSFSDIFCIHNISSTKSISNQSLSITAILSRHGTRRSGTLQDKTAACSGRSIPYELDQPIIVSSRKVPPHKGTKEAQRDKTKSCCTGLTCQHNNTNHDTVLRVYDWPSNATEVATKGFTVYICRMLF